ncbi:MAG TPA: ATP-binding protein, partial [Thermoanaerobaculia bacterium]|nr:ATP-binding protein [Thermoanaerobaculia bacterium]
TTFEDIDDELYTLAVALGSSFELEGVEESVRDALKLGLEKNLFEFKLANHSVILFLGDKPVALSGNLLETSLPVTFEPYRERPEVPFTMVEPYSGQNRTCRFLVTHLAGRARGATLVLFRGIEQSRRALNRLDRALLGFVIVGFSGTAGILTLVLRRALRPVEEITRVAEALEATDLSRRVPAAGGGEEFRRLAAVINSLLARIEQAFAAQKRLVADAAHELKTPAAVLLGEAQEALRQDASPEERRASLETIDRASRGLARQVEAILFLARGDVASPERREPADLNEIADEAAAAASPLGAARGVRCSVSHRGPAPVSADRAALLSAAVNLVSNALIYTDAHMAVDVAAGSTGGEAFLEVADRGPGVPQEDRARIFERFVRLDRTRARNPEGSGLGLAIVEQVARSHAGKVEVEDREGGGAVFRLTLPRAGS